MSKIKPVNDVPKAKLIRRNRRTETRNKKAQRKHKSDYYWCYYIKDSRYNNEYKIEVIPEKEVKTLEYTPIRLPAFDDSGSMCGWKTYNQYYIKTSIVPEHTIRHRIKHERIDIDPILKKVDTKSIKKTYRKIAKRQLRRKLNSINNDIANGSSYKKDFDVAWNVY